MFNLKKKSIIVFLLLISITFISASPYSDCSTYGNCKTTSTNNAGNITNIYNNNTYINGSSYNASYVPYTGATTNVNLGVFDLTAGNLYASYLGGTVGSLDMAVIPWLLSANLSSQDISPSSTLMYSLGSGALRWLKLWVQNISAENIDTFTLHATDNITTDSSFIGDGSYLTGITYNYNQTYTGGTYNATYHTWLSNYTASSKYWYNMSSSGGTSTDTLQNVTDRGNTMTKGILSTGTNTSFTIPSGGGTRFMWYPAKSAFRAGTVSNTQWNDFNIGASSFAVGELTIANQTGASAFGHATIASGYMSTVFGYESQATASYATAFGVQSKASGNYATCFGASNLASGEGATAFGVNCQATSDYSTAFGSGSIASGSGGCLAVGSSALSSGFSSMGLGNSVTASGDYSTAFGHYTSATNTGAFSVGYNTQYDQTLFSANGIGSVVMGYLSAGAEVLSVSVDSGGTGYAVGDILALDYGTDGTVTVSSISGGGGTGQVTGVTITNAGSGYYVEVQSTTAITGTGEGCTISVDSVSGSPTMKVNGTGSIALGQDVNADANNCVVIGKGLTVNESDSYNVGFGLGKTIPDFQVKAGIVKIVGNQNITNNLNVGGNITANVYHGMIDWINVPISVTLTGTTACSNLNNLVAGYSYTCQTCSNSLSGGTIACGTIASVMENCACKIN